MRLQMSFEPLVLRIKPLGLVRPCKTISRCQVSVATESVITFVNETDNYSHMTQ